MEASWISPVVFPSPVADASSGSLLVAETRIATAVGSHASLTCHAAWAGTIRWFGGHRTVGLNTSVSCGGVVFCTVTFVTHVATLPDVFVGADGTRVVLER